MHPEDVGLTSFEFDIIKQQLRRAPNDLELGLFGVLWSEHCSYKSSKSLLSWLPNSGPFVVQGPGENAGVVNLDGTWDVAFKVESHNHPSYVEPVQGAATGVGGIIRDIVAMGARPIALADSLRFGTDDKARHIQNGVVEGIGMYGNAIGIPTVTGEVFYAAGYNKNPLVNALCVGLRPHGRTTSAQGAKPGAEIYLIGQSTGRDGIHGASLLASQDFGEETEHMRPTVQVGDPFYGKLLMEATLTVVDRDLAESVQDLGAAGLTSSVAELCYRSEVGATLWLDRVPCREPHMTPYEIMLSETQERMLLVVDPAKRDAVLSVVNHFEIPVALIGQIDDGDQLVLVMNGVEVANVPPSVLAGSCPRVEAPVGIRQSMAAELSHVKRGMDVPFESDLAYTVLRAPDVRDRRPIYERYDSTIQIKTVWGPDHDLAILTIPGSDNGLGITLSGPGRWAAVDSWAGGAGAVSRVIRQLSIQGATPLGLTDGLNAGNPERPEVYRSFASLIAGIADAATDLGVAVTGGNVSLHNETDGKAIWPTGVIGAVGRHPFPLQPLADGFTQVDDVIFLINPAATPDLGGSVLAMQMGGAMTAYPRPQLKSEEKAYSFIRDQVSQRSPMIHATGSVNDGGVFVALFKMALRARMKNAGLSLVLNPANLSAQLFNEMSGQMVVVVAAGEQDAFEGLCQNATIPTQILGTVTHDGMYRIEAGKRYQWDINSLLGVFRDGGREVT